MDGALPRGCAAGSCVAGRGTGGLGNRVSSGIASSREVEGVELVAGREVDLDGVLRVVAGVDVVRVGAVHAQAGARRVEVLAGLGGGRGLAVEGDGQAAGGGVEDDVGAAAVELDKHRGAAAGGRGLGAVV